METPTGKRRPCDHRTETGGLCLQAKNTTDGWPPPEAGRGRKDSLPEPPERLRPYPHLHVEFWPLGVRGTPPTLFQAPGCGHSSQQPRRNAPSAGLSRAHVPSALALQPPWISGERVCPPPPASVWPWPGALPGSAECTPPSASSPRPAHIQRCQML